MRFALIQSDAGLGRNALSVAREVRRRGNEATLVVPQIDSKPSTPAFAGEWRAEGFSWIPVTAARLEPPAGHFPEDPALAAARRLSEVLTAFDAAWFFECHWAMPALRDRRFRDRLLPLIVLDKEPDPDLIPKSLTEINFTHSRQYALQWADLICSSQEADVASSVSHAEELWRQRDIAPPREPRCPATSPAVTVCIPYFEAPSLLPETLRSLEQQTCGDFTVVVVDDGSRSDQGRAAFDACASLHAKRGWKFVRQSNLFPGAARNRAARDADTEFLLFLDADDIAMPSMVERFLRAALISGDDCLVVPNYGFRDEPLGPCELLYDPPGSLVGSMVDDMHGGSCIFVRRESFWSIGGFTELRGVGFEDYEFHVRCNLEGLRWDVLPEFIYRYRLPAAGSVSRSTQAYANLARVRRWYEDRLAASKLRQLPLALASAYWRDRRALQQKKDAQIALATLLPPLPSPRQGLKLLMLTCHFPFGASSGWHRRAQETIRYFGARYELTLLTFPDMEGYRGAKKEALRHLHALREVELTGHFVAGSEGLPARVRDRYRQATQLALQALPTERFHAAILDTIFLAEFRHDIQTAAVLSEQNIESRLLRQASLYAGAAVLPEDFESAASEAARMEEYEKRTWPAFPLRAAVSAADKAYMDSRAKSGRTVVAPNGADLSIWLKDARARTGTVLFAGHLGYLPNIDGIEFLLDEVWPEVRKRNPGANLIIAGRSPGDMVRRAVSGVEGVQLSANPKSMSEVARRASITVAPLRLGSGTRIKILESMAWGLPVVSTSLGCEGIEAVDEEHLLIRDDPKEFAEAIARLLSDEVLWSRLRHASRDLVRDRYSWDCVFESFDDALLELASQPA